MSIYSEKTYKNNQQSFMINDKELVIEKELHMFGYPGCFLMIGKYDKKKVMCIEKIKIIDDRNMIDETWWILKEIDEKKYESFEEWCISEINKEDESDSYCNNFAKYALKRLYTENDIIYIFKDLRVKILEIDSDNNIDIYDRKRVIETIKEDPERFKEFSRIYANDREVAFAAVRLCSSLIQYVSDSLKDDEELVRFAFTNSGNIYEHISERLKHKEEFILAARRLPEDFLTNKEKILRYFDIFCEHYTERLEKFCDDEDIMKKYYLEYLYTWSTNRYSDYPKIIYEKLPDKLKYNKEIIKSAIRIDGKTYNLIPEELKSDKDIVYALIDECCIYLRDVPEKYKEDKELVLRAVRNSIYSLEYAAEKLKNDKEVILAAIESFDKIGGVPEASIPEKFRNDEDIKTKIKEVLSKEEEEKEPTIEEEYNKEFILKALYKSPDVYNFLSDESKNDLEILQAFEAGSVTKKYFKDGFNNKKSDL